MTGAEPGLEEQHPVEVAYYDVPYRDSHRGADKALDYDRDFWRFGTAKAQNWALERALLGRAFAELPHKPARVLDFACGTGRVLAELEARAPEAIGVDISPDMLDVARDRCGQARLICADVTQQPDLALGGPLDVVTSFRFFLNAEPGLRRNVLAWIHDQLGPDGRLIANFHLNPRSLRGLYLRARWRGRHRVPMMSPREVEALLAEAGFVVEDVQGYEYLPYRRDGADLALPRLRHRIEHALLGRALLRPVAGCHLVTARATTQRA